MTSKKEAVFVKGNEAIILAALRAGCQCFFGYPITPSSEALEEAIERFPQVGRIGVQMESEIAAGFACYGAAAAGERVITVTSGPGMNWLQDAICYMATAELPGVFVNIMRAGPALGNVTPSQGDYFQAVKGGGNGDYHSIVLAPERIQELVDLIPFAFEIGEKYRTPVIILGDGMLGQMKESVVLPAEQCIQPLKPWRVRGRTDGTPNKFVPFSLMTEELVRKNKKLQGKYQCIKNKEVHYELVNAAKADVLVVAFGSVARIVKTVIEKAKERGIAVGLLRPITLWPFPEAEIRAAAAQVGKVLVVEMNCGQMLEDVERAASGLAEVAFLGKPGGEIPTTAEILSCIQSRCLGRR